jgi:hypothetical protein
VTWVHDPALARVWQVLRSRLEERGLRPEGRVVLTGLDRAERHAAAALLGRPITAGRCTIDLAVLDAALVARSGIGGLPAVLEAVTGRPLRDRPAERARHAAARSAPIALARELLPGVPWREEWLDGVRRAGLLTRARDAPGAVRSAVAVLARLGAVTAPEGAPPDIGGPDHGGEHGAGPDTAGGAPGTPARPSPRAGGVSSRPTVSRSPRPNWSRTDLAAAVTGESHALDDGRTVTALVLRALAARRGEPPPVGPAARRELWEGAGVRVDAVSTTCLVLGLRASGGALARRLALAADEGDPVHLTAWDLRRVGLAVPPRVLVCENPRVLEAVAERHGGRYPVVCTSGRPVLVVLDVLRALSGATLRYHGDFDWPGVAIANRLVTDVGVHPWRMDVDDYTAAVGPGLPLAGDPVEPSWDAELGAAMRHHGTAVHEEAVLHDLLDVLDRP